MNSPSPSAPGPAEWHHARGAYDPSGKAGREGGE
jgi:hypothetical protein